LPEYSGVHCEVASPSTPDAPASPLEEVGKPHHVVVLMQPGVLAGGLRGFSELARQPIVRVVDYQGGPVDGTVYHVDVIVEPSPVKQEAYGSHAVTSTKGVAMFEHIKYAGRPGVEHTLTFKVRGLIAATSVKLPTARCPGRTTFSEEALLCQCAKGQRAVWDEEAGGESLDPVDCVPCGKGTYKTAEGQNMCLSCPEGETTQGEGSTSASACFRDVSAAGPSPAVNVLGLVAAAVFGLVMV
jgi:hypothetical protein